MLAVYSQHQKSNELTISLLYDIYDIHRAFKFTNYHYLEYGIHDFKKDIKQNNLQFYNKHNIKNLSLSNSFSFSPYYVINDDIEEIHNFLISLL